jgi:hypothetical protein
MTDGCRTWFARKLGSNITVNGAEEVARRKNMDRGKWIRVSLLLMLALTLAIPAMAQLRDPRLSDSQEPGSVIVFHKFISGTVSLNGDSVPRTEIEVGVVCPKGARCEQEQDVKIRFHWVCPADQTFENKFICKEVDFDAEVTVNGKLVFDPNGGRYPPPPCDRGYLIGWVIDADNFQPIKFDGLIGDAVIRETAQDSAAYNAVPIQAYWGDPHGATRTLGDGGSLVFNGQPGYYQAVTGKEYCDVRFDKTTGSVLTATSLTLLTLDVRSNRSNNPTFVDFNCYNEDERLISVSTEFICWTQVGLSRTLNGIPPINSSLTETSMGSRKGLCLSKAAEQLASPFGNSTDVGPVTLLALVETIEYDGQMRLTAHSCYNDSVPVPTTFYP